MKKLILLLILANPYSGKAQTTAEWTRQKATQIKYLYQQLAALEVYAGRLKEGYAIARKGLNTVRNIRNGEWRLHEGFIKALDIVSPAIKAHPKVAATLFAQKYLLKETGALRKQLQEESLLTSKEKAYVESVCDNLLKESVYDLDELLAIITSNTYQMDDAERIGRMETLFRQVQEKGVFIQSFRRTVASLADGKKGDLRDINISKRLNGLP
jgi:hypothetical protein